MSSCPLPPPKVAPQGAAHRGTPTGHLRGDQAGVGGGPRLIPWGGRGPGHRCVPAAKPPVPAGRQAPSTSSLRLPGKSSRAPWEPGGAESGEQPRAGVGGTTLGSGPQIWAGHVPPRVGRTGPFPGRCFWGGGVGRGTPVCTKQRGPDRCLPRGCAIAGWGQSDPPEVVQGRRLQRGEAAMAADPVSGFGVPRSHMAGKGKEGKLQRRSGICRRQSGPASPHGNCRGGGAPSTVIGCCGC